MRSQGKKERYGSRESGGGGMTCQNSPTKYRGEEGNRRKLGVLRIESVENIMSIQ